MSTHSPRSVQPRVSPNQPRTFQRHDCTEFPASVFSSHVSRRSSSERPLRPGALPGWSTRAIPHARLISNAGHSECGIHWPSVRCYARRICHGSVMGTTWLQTKRPLPLLRTSWLSPDEHPLCKFDFLRGVYSVVAVPLSGRGTRIVYPYPPTYCPMVLPRSKAQFPCHQQEQGRCRFCSFSQHHRRFLRSCPLHTYIRASPYPF